MSQRRGLFILAFALRTTAVFSSAPAPDPVGPSFHPDVTFKGSSLTGWRPLGGADWHAENGEIDGTPKDVKGGWLVLDHPYQDIGLFLRFKCTGTCESGVLFRIQKTPTGMKGVYAPLVGSDTNFYNVTLDESGHIVDRVLLRRGGGQMRIAPPANLNTNATAVRRPGGPSPTNLPFQLPDNSVRPGDWNQAEFMFDANIIRNSINDGREVGAVDDAATYGPIALYVGGSGKGQFKDIAYKNVGLKDHPPETTASSFRRQQINSFYYSFGAATGDFNHDGVQDVVSGPLIYYGPDYTKTSEVWLAHAWNVSTEYANDSWMEFAADFTGDGWSDVLTCNIPGSGSMCDLYVNPKGEDHRWSKSTVVTNFQTEIALVQDIDGDGRPELIYGGDNYVRYAKPDPANPTGPWIVHNISEEGFETAHGIGVGDINGDGRLDVVNPYGWWEQPPAGSNQKSWTYHPEVFGRFGRGIMGGSVMAVYDVNGDGLNDVVTVLNAHGWGMAWFEQKRDASGKISFVKHMIMDDFNTKNAGDVVFSEPHGTTVADVDGDGIPDFVVGKRFWSHRDDYLDPDPYGPALLYWYKTVRDKSAPGGARFVPELINNRSGAGSDILATDLNKDGAIDIVTATRFGTFIFWGTPHGKMARPGQPAAATK